MKSYILRFVEFGFGGVKMIRIPDGGTGEQKASGYPLEHAVRTIGSLPANAEWQLIYSGESSASARLPEVVDVIVREL